MLKRPLPPVKFLIVDDREENLYAVGQILQRDGLEIVFVRSGHAALEALLQHDFALAIIDVQMPEMDGVELAELMRGSERTQHVPIVLVTASGHENSRLFRGYEAGAVDFLYKPVEPVVLRNKAQTFFDLFRQKQLLEETLRLNEIFVAAVGHDLRNPLAAVLTSTLLIGRRAEDPETVRLAHAARTSAQRMQRMTGALFDLTRARFGGGIPIERAWLDLRELATRVFEEQELTAPTRCMSLKTSGDLVGHWDETRLEQVLSNLLGNAVRHGAADSPIVVELIGSEAHAQIVVTSGGTIPRALRASLFDPYRKRSAQARADGLGLGLFIVQQVAIAHDGRVELESSDEGTTTFRVWLPRSASGA